ncbi:MAG: DUF2341 domain-containing protein [candidate division SR1 bacterium]|nr:DUF2341 domain-containing protein [candidate division SR1 bacterium]
MNLNRIGPRLILLILIISLSTILLGLPAPKVRAIGSITQALKTSNSLGSAQTNYPTEYILNTATLISSGTMRSDCGDIRMFSDSGLTTSLTYAVLSCNTTYTSVVYIVPSLATGFSTQYINYNDPPAITTANPTAVFDKYEMSTATPPTCTLGGSATWDATNKWLALTAAVNNQSGTCNYSYSSSLATKGYRAFYQTYAGGGTGADSTWQYAFDSAIPTAEDIVLGGQHFTYDEFQSRMCFTTSTVDNGTCDASFANTIIGNGVWRSMKVSYDPTSRKMFEDGQLRINATTSTNAVNTANTFFGFAGRTGGQNNIHRIRALAIMKYSESVYTSLVDNLAFSIRNATDTVPYNNICDFGDLVTSAVASCQYRLKVTSIAKNGYSLQVKTSGNLLNGAIAVTNAIAGTGGVGGTLIVAGTEMYGVIITPNSCSTGTMTPAASFNPASGNAVLFNYTTATTITSCNSTNQPITIDTTNTVLVDQRIAISSLTSAGIYVQTVTWTVVPNY